MSPILNDKFARVAALKPARKRVATERATAGDSDDASGRSFSAGAESATTSDALVELLGATVGRNQYGEHLVVRRWFYSPEPCEPSLEALRLLVPPNNNRAPRKLGSGSRARTRAAASPAASRPDETLSQLADPAQWLFLDTETTGLAGGTGTYPFLVGLAWWDAGGLQVEQFFMRDYGEEHSLLLEIARRMAERPVLVTFNGKSFDWPLLETRYTMTRAIRAQTPAAHLDLLHSARQLWRLRLGSVRLIELERYVLGAERLGWHRREDVDSALIPQIYFDYLRGGPLEPLTGVFRHNQMDLRGLAALAGRILALLDAPAAAYRAQPPESLAFGAGCQSELAAGAFEDPLDLCGLSKLLRRRGELSRARALYERALSGNLPGEAARTARRELALLARRDRDFPRANALWEELAAPSLQGLEAYEQLAIHYEHRARNPAKAAQLARQALATLRKAVRAGRIEPVRYRKLQARLEHRLARVERKVRSGLFGPVFPES